MNVIFYRFIFQYSIEVSQPQKYVQGGGAGGQGALAPHVLGIYLVNFGNFWKFIFHYLLSPPHKKFASAHPGCKRVTFKPQIMLKAP